MISISRLYCGEEGPGGKSLQIIQGRLKGRQVGGGVPIPRAERGEVHVRQEQHLLPGKMETAVPRGMPRRRDDLQDDLPQLEELAGEIGGEMGPRPEMEVLNKGAPPVIPEVGVGDPHEPKDSIQGGKGLLFQERAVEVRLGEEVVVLLVVFVKVAEEDPGHPPGAGQFPEIILIGCGVHHPGFRPLIHHQGVAVGIAPAFASGDEGDGAKGDGLGRGGPGGGC